MPSWPVRQSEVVGGGQAHSGSTFRALVPLVCKWCAAPIAPGDHFTRRARPARSSPRASTGLHVVCASCSEQDAQERRSAPGARRSDESRP